MTDKTLDEQAWADEIADVDPLDKNVVEKKIKDPQETYKKRKAERFNAIEEDFESFLFSEDFSGSQLQQNGFQAQSQVPFTRKVYKETLFCAARGSVSTKIFQQLKKGEMRYHAVLDMHGLREQDAYLALSNFIQRSAEQGLNCVLIVHGKGSHNDTDAMGLIKRRTPEWLEQQSLVLAYHTTQPKHGGSGAVYVLLRRL